MAQVLPAEHDLRRVIGDGESVPDGEVEGLSEDDLLELHRGLVLMRTYDERSVIYHSQGRIGTYAIFWNHEAMQVGSAYALEDEDWIFPSYRESAIGLLRGMPAATILSWWRGHPSGWWNPLDYNVASVCVPIGTHVPHAAGLAWGKKLRGERACAIAYFGDGATSEGAFHEGANFAAVMRAPLVLFCNNNQWAISTPLEAQTAAETLADKAVGYGIPGVRVDGGDVLAVYEATRDAVARARAGEGPTLIEARTYRLAPHNTSDDSSRYLDPTQLEEARARDPVPRLRAFLSERGVLDEEAERRLSEEVSEELAAAVREMESESEFAAEQLFEHVYETLPPRLERQRRALTEEDGEPG
jgi:pyruvate dehydrogenase E1 component alpha subunit